jgi:hypothetical protein
MMDLFGRLRSARWSKDLLGISSIHATVTGVLAGFCIAVVVLLANSEEYQRSTSEQKILKQATIGIYLVAFIGYVATAILYTVVVQRSGKQRFFLYSASGGRPSFGRDTQPTPRIASFTERVRPAARRRASSSRPAAPIDAGSGRSIR